MELWIRSQDRDKLLLAKELYVFSNEPMTNKTYKIVNNYNENLGIYKTKERALEVLDEIQHRLITLCGSMNRKLYAYEMPQE